MGNNRIKKSIEKDLPLICIIVFFLGVYTFMVGVHNVDHCNGLMILDSKLDNVNIKEKTTKHGKEWSLEECYITGLKDIDIGLFLIIVSSILFGRMYQKYRDMIKEKF